MKQYDYIFLDLDGTLTDPALGITNAVMYALEKYGIHVADRRELFKFIGPPLVDSFQAFYGFSPEKALEATKRYREYFADRGIFENKLYPGIIEALEALKRAGKHLVMATSKPEAFAKRIAEHFGFAQYFEFIGGAAMNETRTKKWEVIEYDIENCHITDRSRILMVGDREHDILGAKHCALDSMGVLYGYGDRAELEKAGADYIAETVSDLSRMILT